MSERRRWALLMLVLVCFAAVAVAVNLLLDEPSRDSHAATPAAPQSVYIEPGGTSTGQERARVHDRRDLSAGKFQGSQTRSEAAPPVRKIERRDREVLASAGPVARRFLEAFGAYEVGDAGRAVLAKLRETTTPDFFRELASAPPRLPSGGAPARAELASGFDVVPIEAHGGGLSEVELVGTLVRSGETRPIGIRMRQEEGPWRVAGLTG